MRSRFLPFAVLGALGLGAVGAACGLGFSDIGEQSEGGTVVPSGTTKPTATSTTPTPTTDGTAPQQDGATGSDATAILDSGLPLDAGDARPPPTSVPSRVTFRFEVNYPCGLDGFTVINCTRNEGTFNAQGRFRGASAAYLGSPGGTGINAVRLDVGSGPSTNAVDIDDGTDVIPVGAATTKLTVAAWVKRANSRRDDPRIVSLAPKTGGMPIFELGFKAENDTKLRLSIGDNVDRGKESMGDLLVEDVWTFVAATFDGDAAKDHVCFYRGTEAVPVAMVNCVDYPGRNITRAISRFSIGNAANEGTRTGARKVSFPGNIDNVFVYVGDALDLAELDKLQRD